MPCLMRSGRRTCGQPRGSFTLMVNEVKCGECRQILKDTLGVHWIEKRRAKQVK